MFCAHCGVKAQSDAKFCFKCGEAIPAEAAAPLTNARDSPMPALAVPSHSLTGNPELVGVKGWLWWLCVILTVVTPLATIAVLFHGWNGFSNTVVVYSALPGPFNFNSPSFTSSTPHPDGIFSPLSILMWLQTFGLMVLGLWSVRAGLALWGTNTGAVIIAKNYFIAVLVYSIGISVLGSQMANSDDLMSIGLNPIQQATGGIIAFAVWFTYLSKSLRVRSTFRGE